MFLLNRLHTSYQRPLKWFLWLFLAATALGGMHIIDVLQSYNEMETYRERINHVIRHKTILLNTYKLRKFTQKQLCLLMRTSPTVNGSLAGWFEERIMNHIEHGELSTINDLPFFERIVLKSLDGTSAISQFTRKILTAITSRMPWIGS